MNFINGAWVEGAGETLTSYNPATGEMLWQARAADAAQVESAVRAARSAFADWAQMPFDARAQIITAFSERVQARKDELSALISAETGKIGWDAASEAGATIGKAKCSLAAYDERTPTRLGSSAQLRHRPHGVMAVYGPYNFPAHLPNGHITPALLAGNTVVFKPSEQTPAVGEWMVQQWEQAGLPRGVLSLVQGKKETGMSLAKQDINGLLFTGSSATGIALHKQFAGRPEVLLALEMGGNNPLVVHQVSDLKAAVHETLLSAYISSGQRCSCARRLIVTAGQWQQPFLDALQQAVQQLRVGTAGDSPAPFMGPLISQREAQRLLQAQTMLQQYGGVSLVTMQQPDAARPLLTAGLIDVTDMAQRPDEEWFGPLLQVIRVPDFSAAIDEANRTRYGLTAGLLCDDASHFDTFVQRINAGIINWNRQTTGASGAAPFGGVGLSGNHHPAGYYAADYCAWPVASMVSDSLALPQQLPPGLAL